MAKVIKKKPLKRVALVGSGPGYHLAPWSGEVWVLNNFGTRRYCTMIWDMHNFNWSMEESIQEYRHLQLKEPQNDIIDRVKKRFIRWMEIKAFCNKFGTPLMSVEKYQDVPSSMAYPLNDIIRRFDTSFFTCCISYAVAYAIYTNHTHIDLYGCNLEKGSEWEYQRDCLSFWLGYAKGSHIKVTVSGVDSRPLRIHPDLGSKLYSYDMTQPECGIIRTEELDMPWGRKMMATTWDEGPQHEKSPPAMPFQININDLTWMDAKWQQSDKIQRLVKEVLSTL